MVSLVSLKEKAELTSASRFKMKQYFERD
jgi:hypothetical protein